MLYNYSYYNVCQFRENEETFPFVIMIQNIEIERRRFLIFNINFKTSVLK